MKVLTKRISDYEEVTLENACGLYIRLNSLGASIREVRVPDKRGESVTVTLCPVEDEQFRNEYHGKTVGRTAGRIENAEFSIGERKAVLEKNNSGVDNLHGGKGALHSRVFNCELVPEEDYTDVVFSYDSPNGECGYFGSVTVKVTYRVYERENSFRILFDGTTDEPALLNLTNHVYWNLSGNLCESVLGHELYINSTAMGELNERLIIQKVVPTLREFDFSGGHAIGKFIKTDAVQKNTLGYDHPYKLDTRKADDLAAKLTCPTSGISLYVRTTYPWVVLYSNSQPVVGREINNGKRDEQYLAACLECQYHPDGIHACPNNCGILTPDKPYHEEILYTFETK